MPILRLCRLASLTLAVETAAPLAAFAQASDFPRGTGFYFSLPRFAAFVVVYLLWVKLAAWIQEDGKEHEIEALDTLWNPVTLGCFLVGTIALWLLPFFWPLYVALVALTLGPAIAYTNHRNQFVDENDRLLTKKHFADLLYRYFRIKINLEEEEEDEGPPVVFLGKSRKKSAESAKELAKLQRSKGYAAAQEMVYEAIKLRATDIHLEPSPEEMSVRFRIDGILHAADPFSRTTGDAVINVFKVLADLDIAQKRKPQDGSFSAKVDNKPVDFRISTAGSVAGEKLVLRILNPELQIVNLKQLGMRDKMVERVKEQIHQPDGMFVVCGPTGAGKTTTLYACLNEIDRFQRNVITLENPVEYQLENVTQIEINVKAGKTFAAELTSVLRQDPNVIMIGEIRDKETAEIACQAAQTGHMIFTTVHANDAVSALTRLIDLGVSSNTVANAVTVVLAQRLVRLLCPECKVRYKPNPEMLRKANLPPDKIKYFYRPPDPDEAPSEDNPFDPNEPPEPCTHCNGTGYLGRNGIFELLVVTDAIQELIRNGASPNAIRQEAVKNGMKSLQEDGLRQVIEGKTSIQELLRVCK
jgi:type II secretory ATPase GspE/PulE/Tfp pilus assembly ATPase PilB-like protein